MQVPKCRFENAWDTSLTEVYPAEERDSTATAKAVADAFRPQYFEPTNAVEAVEQAAPDEHFRDLLAEPDWMSSAVRSESWGFWKEPEEDIYTAEDGHPL